MWNKIVMVGKDCQLSQVSYQYAPEGLFIGIVTHCYYNIRTTPIYLL
jgi:hypothetical protein